MVCWVPFIFGQSSSTTTFSVGTVTYDMAVLLGAWLVVVPDVEVVPLGSVLEGLALEEVMAAFDDAPCEYAFLKRLLLDFSFSWIFQSAEVQTYCTAILPPTPPPTAATIIRRTMSRSRRKVGRASPQMNLFCRCSGTLASS